MTEKCLEPFPNINRLENGKHVYVNADVKLTGVKKSETRNLCKNEFFFSTEIFSTNHLGTVCHGRSLAGHRFKMTLAWTTC